MEDVGFQTQHYGDKHLKRRFRVRMRTVGARTPMEYMRILDRDKSEYPKLLNTLTVNVTEWFRNPGVFEKIKKSVLPEIINLKKESKLNSIRLWSIGCSDGKEPYTLAMCIKDVMKGDDSFNFIIFAWDIDKAMLKKAQAGVYAEDDLKGLKPIHLKRYFIQEGDKYTVKPEIRSMVKFEHKDLNLDRKHINIDLVICRNVVIYFTKERKSDFYMEIYDCLKKKGYFIMGMSETLIGPARDLVKAIDNTHRIYQK
jgi:chemotaxis protein methyltransferase CheR